MSNSSFLKSSISLDSPVFTTKITTPVVIGGSGTTATLILNGTSSGITTNSFVILQSTGGKVGTGCAYAHMNITSISSVVGSECYGGGCNCVNTFTG